MHRRMSCAVAVVAFCVVGLRGRPCLAADEVPAPKPSTLDMSTAQWCKDTATFCWSDGYFLPGTRIIGEPNFGYLLQGGGDQFEPTTLIGTAKLGVNVALWGAWMALELTVIPPFTSRFTDTSESVTGMQLKKGGDAVSVDFGFAGGGAFFDGVLSLGGGFLSYNDNQFIAPQKSIDGFVYVALNPVSALRSVVNRGR